MTQNSKLYVGNLSFNTTEDTLRDAFSEHGTVNDVKIITDRDSGRSRGFGFVEMDSAEEAQAAIQELDNTNLDGRSIQVNVARPRNDRGGSRGGYRSGSRW